MSLKMRENMVVESKFGMSRTATKIFDFVLISTYFWSNTVGPPTPGQPPLVGQILFSLQDSTRSLREYRSCIMQYVIMDCEFPSFFDTI